MRIVATIEARMRSTRLPGKVLKPIMGRPMLELMIERLKRVPQLDNIVVATVDDSSCDPIVDLAKNLGVDYYRGSEEDVLDRVLMAAKSTDADIIVEMTGDCPLIDPEIVSRVIDVFLENEKIDYCSNTLERTYPRGMDTQVFPVSVLETVANLTNDPVDHEHVSLYIYQHPEIFNILNVSSNLPSEAAELRLTVDTNEDFQLVEKIYEVLYPKNPKFSLYDILKLVREEPELKEINRHIRQKIAIL